ncbi:hypothetical protein D3C87_505030 [compost metagenome]
MTLIESLQEARDSGETAQEKFQVIMAHLKADQNENEDLRYDVARCVFESDIDVYALLFEQEFSDCIARTMRVDIPEAQPFFAAMLASTAHSNAVGMLPGVNGIIMRVLKRHVGDRFSDFEKAMIAEYRKFFAKAGDRLPEEVPKGAYYASLKAQKQVDLAGFEYQSVIIGVCDEMLASV